ncbi:hypothetical protein N802_11000 [Knoellia sinensis KCTC 19936]|uniref:Uncharacterized protein n=2 Tax=Knoellia TaxID=136099 RepID=A0A0A0J4P4_9MICO|nr:hypothetical protein N802_11000 [Knoellia sinensis KCTC 19936]
MEQPEDQFLNRHPEYAVALMCLMALAFGFLLVRTVHWRRDREAYVKQAGRLQAMSIYHPSQAYARGLVALGWPIYVGFLLIFGLGLWDNLFHRSFDGAGWILVASIVSIWAGLILPYFYWPRVAMPPHARGDMSPFQVRRLRRQRKRGH